MLVQCGRVRHRHNQAALRQARPQRLGCAAGPRPVRAIGAPPGPPEQDTADAHRLHAPPPHPAGRRADRIRPDLRRTGPHGREAGRSPSPQAGRRGSGGHCACCCACHGPCGRTRPHRGTEEDPPEPPGGTGAGRAPPCATGRARTDGQ